MPFKKYKAAHGGRGPLEDVYAKATGGQGLFGRYGMRQERELTDQLIADVSSSDEFKGLAGLLEAGRSPMTREQHAEFRANVTQAALNTRVFNAGLSDFQERMKTARAQAVSKEDGLMLDDFEALANHAQRLAAVGHGEKAFEVFGSVMQNFGAYVARNEEQRMQLESSEAAGRETMRAELQGELNAKIFDPIRQDTANYAAIREQLEGPNGAETAPPSLVSAVLEYAGAQLRASDDGNWSFSIGPLGLSDANLPPMTFSQLRNRLEQAYRGRDEFMRGEAQRFATEAQKRGFGINGPRVDDLYFPLADAAYKQREQETAPPSLLPSLTGSGGEAQPSGEETPKGVVRDTLIGIGDLYQYARGRWRNDFEWLFGERPTEQRMTPGDARPGNTRRGPGSVSGIIRRPVND